MLKGLNKNSLQEYKHNKAVKKSRLMSRWFTVRCDTTDLISAI